MRRAVRTRSGCTSLASTARSTRRSIALRTADTFRTKAGSKPDTREAVLGAWGRDEAVLVWVSGGRTSVSTLSCDAVHEPRLVAVLETVLELTVVCRVRDGARASVRDRECGVRPVVGRCARARAHRNRLCVVAVRGREAVLGGWYGACGCMCACAHDACTRMRI